MKWPSLTAQNGQNYALMKKIRLIILASGDELIARWESSQSKAEE